MATRRAVARRDAGQRAASLFAREWAPHCHPPSPHPPPAAYRGGAPRRALEPDAGGLRPRLRPLAARTFSPCFHQSWTRPLSPPCAPRPCAKRRRVVRVGGRGSQAASARARRAMRAGAAASAHGSARVPPYRCCTRMLHRSRRMTLIEMPAAAPAAATAHARPLLHLHQLLPPPPASARAKTTPPPSTTPLCAPRSGPPPSRRRPGRRAPSCASCWTRRSEGGRV
jgi:hypothetical protein